MKGKKGAAFILVFSIIIGALVLLSILALGIINVMNSFADKEPEQVKKTIEDTNILASLVEVGDFVGYDAGVWKQREIDDLAGSYEKEPSEQGKFGGFVAGDSRNNSITPFGEYTNQYNGWRVLKVVDENAKQTETTDDDTIYIIHAGTTEKYYHTEGKSNETEYILTKRGSVEGISPRDWGMYINEDYASSATSFTKDMLDEWGKKMNIDTSYNKKIENDLITTGATYWLSQAFNDGFVWRVNQNGNVIYYMDDTLGIRPVIKLKKGLKTSGQVEQIVGTDGKTSKMVWNLN